uniref:Uncharacterized protein n=1 Tax=Leersia perrieri TaxID=77586 RepID=A0A0D9V2Z2_9ORYZ
MKDIIYDSSGHFAKVLEKILDAKGKQLEVLIGLASQIHNVIPAQHFSKALDIIYDSSGHFAKVNHLQIIGCQRKAARGPDWTRITDSQRHTCQHFSEALKSRYDNATALVGKLVRTLNSNQKPSPKWPRMRRATVELVICMMETHSPYKAVFREKGMKKALSEMKKTPPKLEKYKLFFGDVGVVLERGLSLLELVAKAKRLIMPK